MIDSPFSWGSDHGAKRLIKGDSISSLASPSKSAEISNSSHPVRLLRILPAHSEVSQAKAERVKAEEERTQSSKSIEDSLRLFGLHNRMRSTASPVASQKSYEDDDMSCMSSNDASSDPGSRSA